MTRQAALGHWVASLRATLGEPVQSVILTRAGLRSVIAMPTRDEMECALDMSRELMDARMGRDGLTAWDVALDFVGGDREHSDFFRSPDRRLWTARVGGTEG